MLKGLVGGVTVLFVAGSSLVYAQDTSVSGRMQEHRRLSQADLNALTDARVGVVKAALQLTPEQAKHWPAVEEAIRARATARQQRLAALAERVRQQHDVDPIALLHERADNLAQRSAELKKLADAWQPLYQSLNADQKQRMRLLAEHVLRVVRDAAETRRMEMSDEDDDQD
jgi:ribosomal 50S subunit-associated protein YjgA (DUF615 family)